MCRTEDGSQATYAGLFVDAWLSCSLSVPDAKAPAPELRASAGDPELVAYARSAVKPMQAVPLIEDGVLDRFHFTPIELALACASHSAEPRHVEGVYGMLRKIGVYDQIEKKTTRYASAGEVMDGSGGSASGDRSDGRAFGGARGRRIEIGVSWLKVLMSSGSSRSTGWPRS